MSLTHEHLTNRWSQPLAAVNRRFEFQKRCQYFIRAHNEALSVVAVRICNKDCLSVRIDG